MIDDKSPARAAPPATAAPPTEPARGAGRIEWLFRDALRQQQMHPLMELVRRYREQAAS
jgi:hypothetical protein